MKTKNEFVNDPSVKEVALNVTKQILKEHHFRIAPELIAQALWSNLWYKQQFQSGMKFGDADIKAVARSIWYDFPQYFSIVMK